MIGHLTGLHKSNNTFKDPTKPSAQGAQQTSIIEQANETVHNAEEYIQSNVVAGAL